MCVDTLERIKRSFDPLTQRWDALAALMTGWWNGRTLSELAADCGLTRQRVQQLLAGVGCTRQARQQAWSGPDSGHRAAVHQIAQARELLAHPYVRRLTAKQRAALLWRSTGLVYSDIARRMGTTAQGVRNFIVAARERLERLDAQAPRVRPEDLANVDLTALLREEAPYASVGSPMPDTKAQPSSPSMDGPAWGEESEPPEDAAGVPDEDEEAEAVEVVQAQPERPRLKLSELQRAKRVVRPQETPAMAAGVEKNAGER